jgi:CheY-like chemotaxis protein
MSHGEPIVILLAEDDPAHAEIIRRTMKISRIANRLEHVSDGQQALDYLYRRERFADPDVAPRPGLILLDLRMPRLDGLDVLRQVKSDADLARIPTVILTTSAAETDMVKAYDAHANSYLVKPVDFDKITIMMKTVGYYWLMWNRSLEQQNSE